MAKERGVFQLIFKHFIASLKPSFNRAKLMGEDIYGTKYYEKSLAPSKRGRSSRYFVPIGKDNNFDQELPAEWESWLRHRRKVPPTKEEIEENNRIALMKKENARQLELIYSKDSSTKLLDSPRKKNEALNFPIYDDYKDCNK